MDERTVITIGREFGSGGHEIGMKLAEKLGIKCYDKELLQVAAKESGLCEELFASQDEKPTNSFLYSLVMDTYSLGYSNSYVDMPINHKVFLAQFDAIKKLAAKESCVIVGRCADYALEDDPFAVSVWIKASLDERIKRIKKCPPGAVSACGAQSGTASGVPGALGSRRCALLQESRCSRAVFVTEERGL